MSKNWVSYKNGNYNVHIDLETGTKIRENDLDFFRADTVESMDIKITNRCDMGCAFCHEQSTIDGKHADLFSPSFLDTLHPYTELAIGGGNPLEHPDLLKFLLRCKDNKWIPSMTINQHHFMQNFDFVKQLSDSKLIYGLGVSVNEPNDALIGKLTQIQGAVVHVIAGLVPIHKLFKLKDNNLKLLILGYKQVRRGEKLYKVIGKDIEERINNLKNALPTIINEGWFNVVSFDNLSLNQLDVKNTLNMTDDEWSTFYMGDDGIDGSMTSSSLFVDMVERKYAKNSCDLDRYDLKNTVEEMFMHLRDKEFYEDLNAEQREQM